MANTKTPVVPVPLASKAPSSSGLARSFQAAKGRFSTRRIPAAQQPSSTTEPSSKAESDAQPTVSAEPATPVATQSAPIEATTADQVVAAAPESEVAAPADEPATSYVDQERTVASQGNPATKLATTTRTTHEVAIPSERYSDSLKPTGSPERREVVISIAAAAGLTKLFVALSLEPGSGPEIPESERARVLNNLLVEAHDTTNEICRSIINDDRVTAPLALRAKILQTVAEYLARQWTKSSTIDGSSIKLLAKELFIGEPPGFTPELADLFDAANAQKAPGAHEDTQEQTEHNQSLVAQAFVTTSFDCYQAVSGANLKDYDPDDTTLSEHEPFSYGRHPQSVTKDLLHIVASIAQESTLAIDDPDLKATWVAHTLRRASALVCAEYRMITDRALRSSFNDNLTAPAALADIEGRYPSLIAHVAKRAAQSYLTIERNAVDCMAASAFKHYVKKPAEQPAKPAQEQAKVPSAPVQAAENAAAAAATTQREAVAQTPPKTEQTPPAAAAAPINSPKQPSPEIAVPSRVAAPVPQPRPALPRTTQRMRP